MLCQTTCCPTVACSRRPYLGRRVHCACTADNQPRQLRHHGSFDEVRCERQHSVLQSVRGGTRVQQTSKHCTELWKRHPLGVACAVGRRQPGLLHVRATTQPW